MKLILKFLRAWRRLANKPLTEEERRDDFTW